MAHVQEGCLVPEIIWSHRRVPRLIQAIYTRNITQLKLMLRMPSPYINIRDNRSRTPLHVAVTMESAEALHLLLLRNAIDIDARDSDDCTPLHRAISTSSIELVQVLLYHGADANARCTKFNNQTPFLMCVSNNCDDIATELLEYVADFNELDNNGHSALYYALVTNSPLTNEIAERRAEAVLPITYLLLSLYYFDNSLFHYCWQRVTHSGIFTRMLLVLLSNDCKFPNDQWLETILIILKAFESSDHNIQNASLCMVCDDYWDYHLFPNLFTQILIRGVEKEVRYTLVYSFLCSGARVHGLDGYTFLRYYNYPDKEEMLHTLVQGGYNVDNSLACISNDTQPLAVMLYMRYTRYSLNHILGQLLVANMLAVYQQLRAIEALLRLCTPNAVNRNLYFTVFRKRFCEITNHLRAHCTCQNYLMRTMSAKKVPRLLELSRDAVRSMVGQRFQSSCSFCCIVRELPLPQVLKKIILYEIPLYD